MTVELDDIRREYLQGGLRRQDLSVDPVEQFTLWMNQIIACQLIDPTAMVVATVDEQGQPSQRIVLLKQFDAQGFVFYTNFGSKKARDIQGNKRVSLHFPWNALERQVKILGTAEKVSAAESLRYFASRPKDSQLAAWASAQSSVISGRSFLLNQLENMKQKFADGKIPLPDFWGGIRVVPHEIEFWQGGANRLHDRFVYQLQSDGQWLIDRRAP